MLGSLQAVAQENDSLRIRLDSTVFSVERHTSLLNMGVSRPTTVRTEQLRSIPTISGTADPIRFVRLLPGVQSGMELEAGLHIQGTEQSHCLLSVEDVPLYGTAHLLGLFPTFIATHYRTMEYSPYSVSANRLGGAVNMRLADQVPRRFRGSFVAGLFETEGTLDIPLGQRSGVFVSARRSYLNLLYGAFLRFGDYHFKYGFGDGNLTWYWNPGPQDRVWADFFYSDDNVYFMNDKGGNNVLLDWKNGMGAAHYLHSWDGGSLKQTLYYTALDLGMELQHPFLGFRLDSDLSTFGYKATLEAGRWRVRADAAFHRVHPQQISLSNEAYAREVDSPQQRALELTAEARYAWPVTDRLLLEGAVKGVVYHTVGGAWDPALLPEVKARMDLGILGQVEALAGMARQYLFQTGLTSLGFPSQFWYLAGYELPTQGSRYAALTWERNFSHDRYAVSLSAYYRDLTNQPEYDGCLLDYIYPDYQLSRLLLVGSGSNYGLGVILHKQAGALTGWISYTLSRSLRTFEGYTFPSNHERIHECNVVANYTRGSWDFGAVLVAASGLPYTAAESVLLLGSMPILNYTRRNADNLDPYVRLDVSVTYRFHRGPQRENGLTFSLYNAFGHKNVLYKQMRLSDDGRSYAYQPQQLYLRFLPALSYFHQF